MDIINTLTEKSLAEYFDHTFLKAYVTGADFEKLCREAGELGTVTVAINSAQICVRKELLKGRDIHVSAAISFPLGQAALEIEVEETKKAIQDGSDEINCTINIGEAKMGHWGYIEEEIRQIIEICRAHKVISRVTFENCYLKKGGIKKPAEIAKKVRPGYIKTSTGFGIGGAILEDVHLMKETVGDGVKVKIAEDVRNWETRKAMIEVSAERIGAGSSITILGGSRNERDQQK